MLAWPLDAAGTQKIQLDELKLEKRFGIGFTAGGPLSVLGVEAAANITENFNMSIGVGTGLDYSTLAIKGRYFLLGKTVSPYIGAGFARWWTDGTKEKALSPSLLVNGFLPANYDPSKGFSVVTFFPCIGAEYMHPFGIAIYAEVQYMVELFSLASGAYAGMGVHWYF
jgi:hypothetical protein